MKLLLLLLSSASFNFCWGGYSYQTVQYQYPVLKKYETIGSSQGSNNFNAYQGFNTKVTSIQVPVNQQYVINTYETSVPLQISKNTIDISNIDEKNSNQIVKIFFKLNVSEDIKQNIIQLLTLDSNANGTYTQYIYQLILQIINLNAKDDVKRTLINLLSSRIQGYKRNGGSNAADEQSIKNQINSLNIDENHKQQMIQILVSNFKAPQNQTDNKSDKNVDQNIGKATVTTSENLNQGTEPSKNTPQTASTLVVSEQTNINQNIGTAPVTSSQISNKDNRSDKNLPQPVSSPAVSQQSQDQFEYLNQYGPNVKSVIKILTEKNVQENLRQSLLQILIAEPEGNGTYAEFVLKLINEILSWNMGTNEQQFVLELLVTRIQHSHATIECSPCEIYSFKTSIDQLNLPSSTKTKILYMIILNFYDIKNRIMEIMVINNVPEEYQKKLLELLFDNSAKSKVYAEYILQLMIQIVYWETGNDVNSYVINLLVFRILQFEANGGSNAADEETIKNRIAQLNTTDYWKNIVIQLLLVDFKGPLLQKQDESNKILPHPVSSPGVPQQSQDQFEYLNQYGPNVKSVIKILTEKNVQENLRQSLLQILIAEPEGNGTYAEFVLKLINEILSWNMGTYEQQFVLELLVTRIQHSHATIECSPCEIYSFKTSIDQLNLPSSIKIKILYMIILNFYDIKNRIMEIMVVNNVPEEDQKKLLELLFDNSAKSKVYAEYILQLMIQIVYWETGNDVNSYVINLLVFRILQFEANGGSNAADEETIKNRIAQLNTTNYWKNIVIQLLLVDFRGQLLHAKKNEIGYSQSNAAQVNKINTSGGNQGSCIGSCSGSTAFLPHVDCTKYCQCSNGRPIVMICPSTLHWNTKLNNCDYPDAAQCQR
ncbi:uncharacterized protein LOC111693251 [Trichogramma pretiosum]|uniref:uncharacterized protein LOC111693251 n=1 Tax=Trichogramma pretiosum TaxID=7493 RepID=UPI000C718FCE|nr:uncharacterized protein LOC111693251 [Trichogramma pretiosum]